MVQKTGSTSAGRAVAQRQERRDWAFTAEPVAEEFGGQQELDEEASISANPACQANALSVRHIPNSIVELAPVPHCLTAANRNQVVYFVFTA